MRSDASQRRTWSCSFSFEFLQLISEVVRGLEVESKHEVFFFSAIQNYDEEEEAPPLLPPYILLSFFPYYLINFVNNQYLCIPSL